MLRIAAQAGNAAEVDRLLPSIDFGALRLSGQSPLSAPLAAGQAAIANAIARFGMHASTPASSDLPIAGFSAQAIVRNRLPSYDSTFGETSKAPPDAAASGHGGKQRDSGVRDMSAKKERSMVTHSPPEMGSIAGWSHDNRMAFIERMEADSGPDPLVESLLRHPDRNAAATAPGSSAEPASWPAVFLDTAWLPPYGLHPTQVEEPLDLRRAPATARPSAAHAEVHGGTKDEESRQGIQRSSTAASIASDGSSVTAWSGETSASEDDDSDAPIDADPVHRPTPGSDGDSDGDGAQRY